MLGWNVAVYRQAQAGASPATKATALGDRLAIWQTSVHGLSWIKALVTSGDAVLLEDGGYPTRFTGRASSILDAVMSGPPAARTVWQADGHDILHEEWTGQTVIHRHKIADCYHDEWLVIEAWDES